MKRPRITNRLLVALAAWVLVACGPGVGGSGTGEEQAPSALPVFGANAAALCSSELAPLLNCPAGAGVAAEPRGGTAAVSFTGSLGGNPVALSLSGNQADLRVGCTVLRFRGDWGQLGAQAARFYGYLDGAGGTPVVATAEARVVAGQIELTLRDANGSVLVGPLLVSRGEPPACA
jgi:hypothetical protein